MARFIVMEEPGRPDDAEFIRDGFSWAALIAPPLWLVRHRLWMPALVFVALAGAAAALSGAAGRPETILLFMAAAGLGLALEGATLRRLAREAQGWRQAGILHAADPDEAEIRWFAARPPVTGVPEARPLIAPAAASRPADAAEAAAFAFPNPPTMRG